jgi:hypothetical protein
VTSGHPPLLHGCPLAKSSFFLLPTFFRTCGQFFLVGSNTCLPSLKENPLHIDTN